MSEFTVSEMVLISQALEDAEDRLERLLKSNPEYDNIYYQERLESYRSARSKADRYLETYEQVTLAQDDDEPSEVEKFGHLPLPKEIHFYTYDHWICKAGHRSAGENATVCERCEDMLYQYPTGTWKHMGVRKAYEAKLGAR